MAEKVNGLVLATGTGPKEGMIHVHELFIGYDVVSSLLLGPRFHCDLQIKFKTATD